MGLDESLYATPDIIKRWRLGYKKYVAGRVKTKKAEENHDGKSKFGREAQIEQP
jgi:hypothetical protein